MEHVGFQHRALLYEGADEYLAGTIPFLRAALEAGEPALVAVRKSQAEQLRGELGREAEMMRFVAIEEVARNPAGVIPLWRENGSLIAEVEDEGRIEEPLVGRLRPGIEQEGGRGLWLTNQLCDLVQIRSGEDGTVVRLHVLAGQHASDYDHQDPAYA
jgi:anti-sigma regulatory factor (Ser/Thr protein kinase)